MKAHNLKIEAVGDFAKRKIYSRIRLSGHWLKEAGFIPGQRVEVSQEKPGELVLVVQETLPLDDSQKR